MSKPVTPIRDISPASVGQKKAPGPRSLSPLGSVFALQRDTIKFGIDMWQRYGDVVRFRFLFWPAHVLYHPDHVRRVLQENNRNYNKNFPNMQAAREIFGNGLFSNDGESWLHQRRLIQPAFHHKRLVGFGQMMNEATLALLERWQQTDRSEAPLDISTEMTRLSLRIAG